MKTLKFIPIAIVFAFFTVLHGQTTPPSGEKMNVYLVQTSHSPDDCLNTLTQFRDKSKELLSKFEFGCMSGDHTGYAFLEGKSESEVRQMLPKDAQSNAKIQKVDKFTPDQIEKIQKDKMNPEVKK